jgi:hypothetical protein
MKKKKYSPGINKYSGVNNPENKREKKNFMKKPKMNYGDRQDRALYLIKTLRARPNQNEIIYHGYLIGADRLNAGTPYSVKEIADNIEQQTELGQELVAVAGIVFTALNSMRKPGNIYA